MDETEEDRLLTFCQEFISRHSENWPPKEDVLAQEFVNWLGINFFVTPDAMRELCLSKGINLSFVALPQELHGFNCSFHANREIAISKREIVPFGHMHTLFHEFREMLEGVFVELGHATLTPGDSLEVKAESFAMVARMATGIRGLPAHFEMVANVQATWPRYFGYAFLAVCSVTFLFSCLLLPKFEEIMTAETRR